MPIASRMLSCASRENSCGSTCSTSRSSGSVTPRAASIARRTSSRWTSRGFAPSVIPPRLFTPRTWLPATPIIADSTGTPTIVSASSTARRIELTARSRFTIWPLRQPFDSAAPSAANFTPPSSSMFADQRARLRAADIERHNVPFFLGQIPAPLRCIAPSSRTVISMIASPRACARELSPALTRAAAPPASRATVVSGFTTASPLNRKSTDSTRPAVARHCPISSISV